MLTGDMLRRAAERFPDKAAVICDDQAITYRALAARSAQFAHALVAQGLGRGAKVAIVARNCTDYVTAFFGTALSGAVLVNVSVLYAVEELVYVLDKADVDALIFEDVFADKVAAALPRLPRIRVRIAIGGPVEGTTTFSSFMNGQPEMPPDVLLSEDEAFCMTYTGGTTGRPKGVLASHRARVVTAHTVVVESGVNERDVVAIVTPLFHVAALNIMLQPAILVGATSVLMGKWDVREYARLSRTHGISAAFMVPTQVRMIVSDPEFDVADYQSWRRLNFSGAPMPDWVQQAMLEKLPQVSLTQFYGQSEMGIVASLKQCDLPHKLGCVGRQVFNADMAVLLPDGERVKPGEVGEICARGKNVMLEYYNEPEQTRAFRRHGWAWSGDLATIDADGFVTLVDRSKDMIISGGENIYPKEIEDVLYRHAAVGECAVFGVPDDKWGEVPVAYVNLKMGAQVSEDALIEHCALLLARFKRPRWVKFVSEFPKTPIGKIQKNVLRAPYWSGRDKKI
ncbi:MAG: AMP-binding protein [Rhizobiales bacterium]|nr:AMP-binding protein [Hyphomicrobiales bacterium]OJY46448.1 MAG: long-chain fatty acid--CoA ligase [Rhizobiales bacterium 64-17]